MPLDGLPRISDDSRRHQIVRVLREAIVTGQLQPGERLVERDLSMRLNISRGPVREALRQLEQEGLVVSYPYRATEVVGITADEFANVLVPTRLVLERFALRTVVGTLASDGTTGGATDQLIAELAGIVETMRRAATSGDQMTVVETDMRFHELLIERAERPHCLQIWRTIAPRVRAYFSRDATRHRTLEEIVTGHDELIAALRQGDANAAEAVLERHILETFDLPPGR